MFPFPFSFVAPTASGLADIDNVYSMEFDGTDEYIDTGLIDLGTQYSICLLYTSPSPRDRG